MSGIRTAAGKQATKSSSKFPESASLSHAIKKAKPSDEQLWSFSFRYFKEIKYFGLDSDKIEKTWLLSVIYRLQELSKLTISTVTDDRSVSDGTLRVHNINWEHKNIPIQRKDFDWIDPRYLDNSDDYPIMQFAVSKAEGRLVGFFDETYSFQIVLLDPLHNAQPCKFNDYEVRLCKPLGCEITALKYEAQKSLSKIEGRDCDCHRDLASSLEWSKKSAGTAVVVVSDDERLARDARDILDMGNAQNYAEILQAGIDQCLQRPEQPPG